MKNGSQWRKTLDATDPCWDLFSYKLILNEVRYLTKAFEFMKGAAEANLMPVGDLKELQDDLNMVKIDVEEAKNVLTDTINMVTAVLGSIHDRFTILFLSGKQAAPRVLGTIRSISHSSPPYFFRYPCGRYTNNWSELTTRASSE